LSEMEGLKQQVQAMQMCQSALRLPEDVMAALPLCVTAQSLHHESSHLQHNTIQQCNILQVFSLHTDCNIFWEEDAL